MIHREANRNPKQNPLRFNHKRAFARHDSILDAPVRTPLDKVEPLNACPHRPTGGAASAMAQEGRNVFAG